MGNTTIEFSPKSAMIQRPVEAHHAAERTGSMEESMAGTLYGGSEQNSQQIQRPVEAHRAPEQTGDLERSDVEVLYGGSQERLQQVPLGLVALRQRELGASYSSLPPPMSSGESLFPPVYGTSIQGDLEKAESKSGHAGGARGIGRGEKVKRVVTSGKFWLWVMAVLLLVLVGVLLPLAVVSRR